MIHKYTRFDQTTGRILFNGNCNSAELPFYEKDGGVVFGNYPSQDFYVKYVEDDEDGHWTAVPREFMALSIPTNLEVVADGMTEFVIGHVPEGTHVRLTGPVEMEGMTEGTESVTLVFSEPGTYTVRLTKFPYKDEEVTVNAT